MGLGEGKKLTLKKSPSEQVGAYAFCNIYEKIQNLTMKR